MMTMKGLKLSIIFSAIFLLVQTVAVGNDTLDRDDALDLFKQHINKIVERVEKAEDPAQKRDILNSSFDKMISTFDKVLNRELASSDDREAIKALKANIQEKKNELNGTEGYRKVADNKLNNFANYVQQDLEQADTVVISISATLLAVILVLLLLL